MTDASLTFRAGTGDDVPAILALMSRSLGEGAIPRSREFWAWKHEENPFGRSPFDVAESGGRLVGVRVFMRWGWQCGGLRLPAVRAVDTATDPEFQGKGIFKKLTLGIVERMKREGVCFVFNTPNEQSRPGYLKMGWSSLGRVSLWVRPSPSRVVRAGVARLARSGAADERPEDAMEGTGPAALPDGYSVPDSPTAGARFRTAKTAEYLTWRFTRCPAFRYRFDVEERAVIVSKVRTRFGLRELTVTELLFEQSRRGLGDALRAVRSAWRASEADYAVCAPPHGPAALPLLAAAGFVPAPHSGPVFTVRPLNETPASPLARRSWAPTIGDLELF